MNKILIPVLLLLIAQGPLYGQQVYQYKIPEQKADGWVTAHIEDFNIDSVLINKLFTQLNQQNHEIHSVLIIKDGQLIAEEYFGEYHHSKQHDLRSVTKSFISILMGIALDKGYIKSIDEPIVNYLKNPYSNKSSAYKKEDITIRHLLTMSTGLDCNDWDKSSKGQEDRIYKKKDWLQYTLDLQVINKPGSISNYCTAGVTLAAEIISQASGLTINEFADKYLFIPMKIENVSWGHTTKGREIIPSAKRLYMTPRDLAKIGKLMINNGMWENQQLVSADWIKEATKKQVKLANLDYGYLWWKIPIKTFSKTYHPVISTGNGGQYLMVFKELDLIVVFTGGAYNSQADKIPFALIKDGILPAVDY